MKHTRKFTLGNEEIILEKPTGKVDMTAEKKEELKQDLLANLPMSQILKKYPKQGFEAVVELIWEKSDEFLKILESKARSKK